MLTKIKELLKKRAIEKYGNITTLSHRKEEECYSVFNGYITYWFNIENNSTKTVKERLPFTDCKCCGKIKTIDLFAETSLCIDCIMEHNGNMPEILTGAGIEKFLTEGIK